MSSLKLAYMLSFKTRKQLDHFCENHTVIDNNKKTYYNESLATVFPEQLKIEIIFYESNLYNIDSSTLIDPLIFEYFISKGELLRTSQETKDCDINAVIKHSLTSNHLML